MQKERGEGAGAKPEAKSENATPENAPPEKKTEAEKTSPVGKTDGENSVSTSNPVVSTLHRFNLSKFCNIANLNDFFHRRLLFFNTVL